MATIDMQTMRYINLLDRIAHVRAAKCFTYNNTIYFAVPYKLFSKALGPDNENVKILAEQLGKRIRIVRDAHDDVSGISKFIESVVSPVGFVSLEMHDGTYILTAGSRERAATLIGRNKVRLEELNAVIESYFGKTIKIV